MALDALQLELHVGAELLVEGPQRLVHQEHARPEHERARQGDALLLAARDLPWEPPIVALEAHELERFPDAPADLGAGQLAHFERERDVLEDGEMREDRVALEDHPEVALLRREAGDGGAVDEDLAARGMEEAGHHHQRGRLPRAARSQEREERAGGDGHRHVLHRDHRPEDLGQVLEANLAAGSYPFCSSHCDQRSLILARLSAHHLPFCRNAVALCSGLDGSRAATSAGMDLKAWRLLGP